MNNTNQSINSRIELLFTIPALVLEHIADLFLYLYNKIDNWWREL